MSQMQDYNSVDPPTRVQTWKMLNEAWGYVTGDLNASDFAADAKIQEGHIKFVESGHTHNGTDSHAIAKSSLRKKNFDLQTCNIAWGVYFQDRITEDGGDRYTYLLLGGTGHVSLTSGGGAPPVIAGVVSGEQDIDYTGTARLHLGTGQLAALDANWTLAGTLVGAIVSPIYATPDEMACYMLEVDMTNDRVVGYSLSKDSPSEINYDYIVVLRIAGGVPS